MGVTVYWRSVYGMVTAIMLAKVIPARPLVSLRYNYNLHVAQRPTLNYTLASCTFLKNFDVCDFFLSQLVFLLNSDLINACYVTLTLKQSHCTRAYELLKV